MIRIGLDLGCTRHKYVMIEKDRMIEHRIIPSQPIDRIEREHLEHVFGMKVPSQTLVYSTGGRSRQMGYDPSLSVTVVNELMAIAGGGRFFLPEAERFLSVSVGTGTCMVLVDHGHYRHMGGTGIGGGTLEGLSRLCLRLAPNHSFNDLFDLARLGRLEEVDITVKDVVGSGIGIVPPDASASHLAKLSRTSRPESIALGLINMVATEIANLVAFCTRNYSITQVVFMGSLIQDSFFTSILKNRLGIINPDCVPFFPAAPALGNALGAVYSDGLIQN